MDETIEESRELRRKLIDTQTNLAIVRSEMEKLRSEYEIKCEQFNNKYVDCKCFINNMFDTNTLTNLLIILTINLQEHLVVSS